MKIASWNVNSIRVRIDHVRDWLKEQQADVLGLQEIKMPEENYPASDLEDAGYHSLVNGQKTYNGVALLSREQPEDPIRDLPGYDDPQKRVVAATYRDIRAINVYVPNGQTVGSDKFEYKLEWLDALREFLAAELLKHPRLVVFGDYNIAPEDRDVHDPAEWEGKVLCSDAERKKLRSLMNLGLVDSYRLFDQAESGFSWWDYRAGAFRRNRGLRIDLMLVSESLAATCSASGIDPAPRRLERPSDHAPVWAVFD